MRKCTDAVSNIDFEQCFHEQFEICWEKTVDLKGTVARKKDVYNYSLNKAKKEKELIKSIIVAYVSLAGKLAGEQLLPCILDDLRSNIGVLCLSENCNSELMWAHYSDSHKGFVIEFDSSHSFFKPDNINDARYGLRKVQYSRQRLKIPELLNRGNSLEDFFYRKSDAWKYEDEWRLVRSVDSAESNSTDSSENVVLFEIPEASITSVITGHNSTSETRRMLREVIEQNENYKHVKLQHARFSDENYDIIIEA